MSEILSTVDQAIQMLFAVAERGPVTTSELARYLGRNRTVVHRTMATLHGRGMVRKQGRHFTIGAAVIRMAELVEPELISHAKGVMAELADEVAETVLLTVRDGREGVVVHSADGSRALVRATFETGFRSGLEVGARCRSILAFSDEATIQLVMKHVTDPAGLEAALEEVRDRGYTMSHDEQGRGLSGLSTPIIDQGGLAAGALSIVVPLARGGSLEAYIPTLLKARNRIAADLGTA